MRMHSKKLVGRKILFFLLMSMVSISLANSAFAQSEHSLMVDDAALTCFQGTYGNSINGQSFQQDALKGYKGWQYIAYYNAERQVCLARRKLAKGAWEIIKFKDYHFSYSKNQDNDSHNAISMGFCINDGTIHLSFDQHCGPLHYRVSVKDILNHPERVKWDSSIFNPIINYLEVGKPIAAISYPAFISTPQGNMLLVYRSGYSSNGDCLVGQYNGLTSKWTDPHIFISKNGIYNDVYNGEGKTRNAYLNNLSYDNKGGLYVSWTWRESVGTIGNRDVCYAYSKDNGNTWYNTKDEQIAVFNASENKVIAVLSPGITIKELDRGWGMMNQQAQTIDANQQLHILMYHKKNYGEPSWALMKDGAYFHYYQKGGEWKENELPFIGNRPKLVADGKNNLFLVFVRKDHFADKTKGAPLVVVRATAKTEWKDWKEVYVSKEIYFNEPQLDLNRWVKEGILSIMLQSPPAIEGKPSALQVVDISNKYLNRFN